MRVNFQSRLVLKFFEFRGNMLHGVAANMQKVMQMELVGSWTFLKGWYCILLAIIYDWEIVETVRLDLKMVQINKSVYFYASRSGIPSSGGG